MSENKEGLKAYLNYIKLTFNLSNKKMQRIEKEVEYLYNEVYKVLEKYPDGKIDPLSFIIYTAYILGAIINDNETLEKFIEVLKDLYNMKKEP
jgi:hypothetical protein